MKITHAVNSNGNGSQHCTNEAGQYHRDNDLPAVISVNGSQQWWVNGQYHRLDGPAYIGSDGDKVWYQNGQRHRIDGPAVINSNGRVRWYVNDVEISKKDIFAWRKQMSIPTNWKTWKDHHILAFKLRFG